MLFPSRDFQNQNDEKFIAAVMSNVRSAQQPAAYL